MQADNLGSKKLLNHFFPFGDTIEIQLTRAANALDLLPHSPAHKFILILHGYNCPEEKSGVW
jgi:hypothetical protein